jgi:hypothetical protein
MSEPTAPIKIAIRANILKKLRLNIFFIVANFLYQTQFIYKLVKIRTIINESFIKVGVKLIRYITETEGQFCFEFLMGSEVLEYWNMIIKCKSRIA